MIRILLVGKYGQIGWELHRTLPNLPVDVVAVGRSELDVTDPQAVMKVHEAVKPDIVINATGYNAVDAAEQHIADAVATNVTGNINLAQAARHINAFYISFSTDYVFDGQKGAAYSEVDIPNPLNVYGRTKLDGESAIKDSGVNYLIIRTSSVFSLRRPCFLSDFLQQAQTSARILVRTDLVSSPTSARFLAEMTSHLIAMGTGDHLGFLNEHAGMYQLAGAGSASRHEWAAEIQSLLKMEIELLPASALDFPSSTRRPAFSALDCSKFAKTFHCALVPWQQLLESTLKEIS